MNIIWSSDINLEEWQDDDGKQLSYEEAEELNYEYLDDERSNLDIAADGEIICIADLGLWDGRRTAYAFVGSRVANILQSKVNGMSYNKWYSNGKDICGEEAHHDGTNYYTYRVLKGNTHDEQVENANKLFSKPLTKQRIGIFTKSLVPIVNQVYGW